MKRMIHASIDFKDMKLLDKCNRIKKFLATYSGTRVFEDFAKHIGEPVEDLIDLFCDLEAHGWITIPYEIQQDSDYANDDLY